MQDKYKSIGSGQSPSELEDFKIKCAFDLKEVKPQQFAAEARKLRTRFSGTTNRPVSSPVTVDYDASVLNQNLLHKTLRTRATADQDASGWRHLTKHRMVTSEATGYINTAGQQCNPYNITVTTTCAPNFMGSSPSDEATFLSNDKDLKVAHYQETMRLIYERCLYAQIQRGTEVLIIPPVGMGLYLNNCKDKDTAKHANYQALCQAIENTQARQKAGKQQSGKLREIICVMPNSRGRNDYFDIAEKAFEKYQGKIRVTLARLDMLDTAAQLSAKNVKTGVMNAGSDRTIGGDYEAIKSHKLSPAEETLGQGTDFVYRQASDVGRPQYTFSALPDYLSTTKLQQTAASLSQLPSNTLDRKRLGGQIASWIGIHSRVWVHEPDEQNNRAISFKTKAEGEGFAEELKKIGVYRYKTTQKKIVKQHGNYWKVYLTAKDLQVLILKLPSPSTVKDTKSIQSIYSQTSSPSQPKSQSINDTKKKTNFKDAKSTNKISLAEKIKQAIDAKGKVSVEPKSQGRFKLSFEKEEDTNNFCVATGIPRYMFVDGKSGERDLDIDARWLETSLGKLCIALPNSHAPLSQQQQTPPPQSFFKLFHSQPSKDEKIKVLGHSRDEWRKMIKEKINAKDDEILTEPYSDGFKLIFKNHGDVLQFEEITNAGGDNFMEGNNKSGNYWYADIRLVWLERVEGIFFNKGQSIATTSSEKKLFCFILILGASVIPPVGLYFTGNLKNTPLLGGHISDPAVGVVLNVATLMVLLAITALAMRIKKNIVGQNATSSVRTMP